MVKANKLLTFLLILLIINYHQANSRRFLRQRFHSNSKIYRNPLNRRNVIHHYQKVQHASYRPRSNIFYHGVGPGSISNAHYLKTALVAGLIGASTGALIGHAITHDNRKYYVNKEYIKTEPDEIMCKMSLTDLFALQNKETNGTQNITKLNFANGQQPKYVFWNCKNSFEFCCGSSCCPKPIIKSSNNKEQRDLAVAVMSIIFVLLILLLCFCIIAWEFFNLAIDFICWPFHSETVYYDTDPEYACYNQTIAHQPQIYPSTPYPQYNQTITPPPAYHVYPPIYTKN